MVNSWSKENRDLQSRLVLSDLQKHVLVGTLLGDGCLTPNVHGKSFRLQIIHCNAQKAYVDWKHKIFEEWCLSDPSFNKTTCSWRFKTVSHPELTKYYRLFYPEKKKVAPQNIEQLLVTPLSLAVWFMDDGMRGPSSGYTFSTNNFDPESVERLRLVLEKTFGLQTSVHKDRSYLRVYVGTNSARDFEHLVSPFMLPELRYKLHENAA